MGVYATAYAGWGWAIDNPEAAPDSGVDDVYEWAEELCEPAGLSFASLGWFGTGAEYCPLILIVGGASANAGSHETARVPERPNPGQIDDAREHLRAAGLEAKIEDFGLWIGCSVG